MKSIVLVFQTFEVEVQRRIDVGHLLTDTPQHVYRIIKWDRVGNRRGPITDVVEVNRWKMGREYVRSWTSHYVDGKCIPGVMVHASMINQLEVIDPR